MKALGCETGVLHVKNNINKYKLCVFVIFLYMTAVVMWYIETETHTIVYPPACILNWKKYVLCTMYYVLRIMYYVL